MITKRISKFCHHIVVRTLVSYPQPPTVPQLKVPQIDVFSLKIGEKIYGFEVKNIQQIKEFNIITISLQHEETKAEYLHLFRNDSNNVFSINFRTTPRDSTGLPHILERMVLCGSKLFPIKDPFGKMANRSVATFMNTIAGPDFTIYSFSTSNPIDYRNLQHVYLDAVFRPNLRLSDFLLEAWRLENAEPFDKTSKIVIKGAVYNEMKEFFSENGNILAQKIQNFMLPDHTYSVIAEGDPLKIPDINWEDLIQFHKNQYHPSNAKFYSYGNFALLPTLKFLNSQYLMKYYHKDTSYNLVPPQKLWSYPMNKHIIGRYKNLKKPYEKQNVLSVSLLMSDVTNTYETCLIKFISTLLLRGPNAPFYKSLIEPKISTGFTHCTGFDTQPRDTIFTVGFEGLSKNDFETVTNIYDETIEEVIATGFNKFHVKSVLHDYELDIKNETSNFGINLLLDLAPTWNHNGNVIELLKVKMFIRKLKHHVENDPNYLQHVVKKYFRDNNHKLTLTMSPDREYEDQQVQLERELLNNKLIKLTQHDKDSIYQRGLKLLIEEETEQNTDSLPFLNIEDMSCDVEEIEKAQYLCDSVPTLVNKVNTNGLVYYKGIIDVTDMKSVHQMLLPLFCNVITKLGTTTMHYNNFEALIYRKIRGMSLSPHVAESLYQAHSYESGVVLSSYCLEKNINSMWYIWNEVFNLRELKDVRRFRVLSQSYLENLKKTIDKAGHMYAMRTAASLVSGASYQKELFSGLKYIHRIKHILNNSKSEDLLKEMSYMLKELFDKKKLRCCLNVSYENKKTLVRIYEKFITSLPSYKSHSEMAELHAKVWTPTDIVNCQHHIWDFANYHCSKAILTVPYTDIDFSKLCVLSKLISTKYLVPELREKHSARAGGAMMTMDGVFLFYSCKDKNHLTTLDLFDGTYNWIKSKYDHLTQQDLLEAKLAVFQTLDEPIPASKKGIYEFLVGLTPDLIRTHRANIMNVNLNDLLDMTEKYFYSGCRLPCSKVILGKKDQYLSTDKRPNEMWTVINKD